MATVTFNFADGVSLKGTAGDDQITLAETNTDAVNESVTIVGGLGNDTLVVDNLLDGTLVDAASGGFVIAGAGTGDTVNASGVETFVFNNGTVTSNAAAETEFLMVDALSQDSGFAWDTENLISFNGTSTATDTDWSLKTVDGKTLTGSNTVTLLSGSTVLGTLSLNGDDVEFTADNAFQTSLDINETADVSFDIVLENSDGDTFTRTVTAVVTGEASDADNTFVASDTAAVSTDLLGGNDRATGGALGDTIFGEDGNDTIYAGATDAAGDLFVGGDGNDILAGGAGDDVLVGDSHDGVADFGTVATDEGSNTIFGGAGDDAIAIGGYDNDGTNFAAGADISDATGTVGGQAFGGAGDDFILGTASGDDLVGLGAGDDTAFLGDGDNTVYAGATDEGDDSVEAGDGDNTVYTGAGDDIVSLGDGDNLVGVGAGDDEVYLDEGNNTVYAGAGDDEVYGDIGDDVIYGGAGDDTIDAGDGDNTVYAGAGDDSLTAGDGDDTFVFVTDGDNIIDDFNDGGTDLIDLTSFGTSFAELITSTDGASTTIYVDADTTITVDVASVDADDFLF